MIHAIGDAVHLVVHLVARNQLAGGAAAVIDVVRKLLQIQRNVVGVVVERFVVDEFAGRTFTGFDLPRQLFGIGNGRVHVVVERFVIEQPSDGAFTFAHALHYLVQLIR